MFVYLILVMALFHFILTRFNLPLWKKDKTGQTINADDWLKDRMSLFEAYCLPSIKSQTCKDFVWILLCDASTKQEYRQRIKDYARICPQIRVVPVKSEYGWHFAEAFVSVISHILSNSKLTSSDVCLTTYFDNDDALGQNYVEDVQRRAKEVKTNSFVYYDNGLQYFTSLDLAVDVLYPNNHFMTAVEYVRPDALGGHYGIRTCFGYGSHATIEEMKAAPVIHVGGTDPMWLEVVHQTNVVNDANVSFRPRIRKNDPDILRRFFSVDRTIAHPQTIAFRWRCLTEFCKWRIVKIVQRLLARGGA